MLLHISYLEAIFQEIKHSRWRQKIAKDKREIFVISVAHLL